MTTVTRDNFIPMIRDAQVFDTGHTAEFINGSNHGVRAVLSLIDEAGFKLVDVNEDLVNPSHPDVITGLANSWDDYVNSINS